MKTEFWIEEKAVGFLFWARIEYWVCSEYGRLGPFTKSDAEKYLECLMT